MKILAFLATALAFQVETNPVGQVLSLLQNLYDTVVTDGEKEQKQFEAFAEWCEDQTKDRQFEVKTGKAQVADLRATIEKANADIEAANAHVGDVAQSLAANEADLKAATSIRSKEHSTFKKEEQELVETVDTLRRAQQVLSKHLNKGGSFAQMPQAFTDLASSLSTILDAAVFSTRDTAQLRAFLQAQQEGVDAPTAKAYKSHSTGILDTLADMQEKAEGLLVDARKAEVNARHAFELLAQSLNDELKVQREDLSNTKRQLAATSETKATAEGDLASTTKDLNEDEEYLRNLSQNCQQRANDFEISNKGRANELQALRDARKIIAEATGAAGKRQYREFLQVSTHTKQDGAAFDKIEATIKLLGKKDNDFALMQLAGQIRASVSMSADPFGKVKGLITGMISRLEQQAQEEASHKAFCDKETSDNEAKRDKLQAQSHKLSTRIEKATAGVAKLKEQVSELQQALHNIAKSQKDMDAMRADEHEEYIKSKADFEQGLTGVRTALKILREYYQQQGEAFMQQPAVGTHSDSSDSGSGIISILEVAESDFARSVAEGQEAEDDAQEVYNKTTQENRVNTATKKALVEGKTQESTRLQRSISDTTSDYEGVQEELSAVLEYLEKLRPQCTTEPESYEDRKARREHEIEGLKDALDILENETALNQESTSFLSVRRIQRHIA
eukprot:GEMP01021459.1.p1 GENE.GEMP01021459.1~~GEMP01021459.1.p1  ORF type:complete len:678 (+),score=266.76 GEMP01021459.1:204-2237(+)